MNPLRTVEILSLCWRRQYEETVAFPKKASCFTVPELSEHFILNRNVFFRFGQIGRRHAWVQLIPGSGSSSYPKCSLQLRDNLMVYLISEHRRRSSCREFRNCFILKLVEAVSTGPKHYWEIVTSPSTVTVYWGCTSSDACPDLMWMKLSSLFLTSS